MKTTLMHSEGDLTTFQQAIPLDAPDLSRKERENSRKKHI
jgi:hypothetical protein